MNGLARFIASGAFIGYAPFASGTFGTIPGVILAFPLARLAGLSVSAYLAVVGASIAIAVWAADRAIRIFHSGDPKQVVADEIVGFFVAVAFIHPLDAKTVVLAFLLFRFFDIVKLWPASAAESWPGGVGVVADDLIAGLYANLSLRILLAVLARQGLA